MTYLEQFIYSQELEPTDISALRNNRVVIEKYYLWRKELDSWISLRGCNYDDMVEELVEVKTENGEIFKAYPTFYNFKIVSQKVVSCDSYWDGGFLFEDYKYGTVTHYRKIK
jgi:hypothetical protein